MGRRGMPGRRKQLIQLDDTPKTSYLTQTGCYRPDDIFIESKNAIKSLSLVGDYIGSESGSDEESDKGDNDIDTTQNGDIPVKEEQLTPSREPKDNLHAEMLGIVGAKAETSADIFLREFNAYQKETAAPVFNREFIVFHKETPSTPSSSTSVSNSETLATSGPSKKTVTSFSSPKVDGSTVSADSNLAPGPTEPPTETSKTPDIDSQVASFLAEIDALEDDVDTKDDADDSENDKNAILDDSAKNGQPLVLESKQAPVSGPAVANGSKNGSLDDNVGIVEDTIVWPEEPVSEWQQCQDESTQHYYYWNVNTNEVTWEIPPEFTQYLLLYKEYEQRLNRMIKEGMSKPKKKKAQKKSDQKKSKKGEMGSWTTSKDDNQVSEVEFGPHLPTDMHPDTKDGSSSEAVVFGPKLPDEDSASIPTEPIHGPLEAPEVPIEEQKSKDSDNNSSSPIAVATVPVVVVEKSKSPITEDASSIAEDANGIAEDSSIAPVGDNSSISNSSETLVPTPNISDVTIELCKKKFKARMSREEDSSKQQQTAEVEPSSLTGDVTQSSKEDSVESEHDNIDIDEVDRELELALERKVNELRRLEEEEEKQEEKQSEASDRQPLKRKYNDVEGGEKMNGISSEDVVVAKSSKKNKSHKHPSKKSKERKGDNYVSTSESLGSKKSESSKKKSSHRDHQSKKESRSKSSKGRSASWSHEDTDENKLKETVLDLNQLVMDKMDFLEIDINRASKLQVLLVQLKTRTSDWQAGGLLTSYFYEKLQEAHNQLIQFEKSGAPAGWSVNWDRTYKRYFYTNNTTGYSQWEYPDQLSQHEVASALIETVDPSLTLTLVSLPPPPPPLPPSSSTTPSRSPSSSAKTVDTIKAASPEKTEKAAKDQGPVERSSEKVKLLVSDGKKDKKSRKSDKLSSKNSKAKDGSKIKSRSDKSHLGSSKEFDSELCVYPGEPPPPGTEPTEQHPPKSLEKVKLSKSGEEDLEEMMKLVAILGQAPAPTVMETVVATAAAPGTAITTTKNSSTTPITSSIIVATTATTTSNTTISTERNDDMEIDPDDDLPSSVHVVSTHESDYKSTIVCNPNPSSNGHIFLAADTNTHAKIAQNSSAVISKPPQYKTRPPVSMESTIVGYPSSNFAAASDSPLTYSASAVPATDGPNSAKSSAILASMPDLSVQGEASNSPNPPETSDAGETPKSHSKEKKRKKDKVITSTSLTLKKKNVSSLVQKWQKVKKEVEKEDELARHEFSDDD